MVMSNSLVTVDTNEVDTNEQLVQQERQQGSSGHGEQTPGVGQPDLQDNWAEQTRDYDSAPWTDEMKSAKCMQQAAAELGKTIAHSTQSQTIM